MIKDRLYFFSVFKSFLNPALSWFTGGNRICHGIEYLSRINKRVNPAFCFISLRRRLIKQPRRLVLPACEASVQAGKRAKLAG